MSFAKRLRQGSTDAEIVMWRNLRAARLAGFKFRRQQPLGKYMGDFVCFSRMLIIEIDGGQHLEAAAADQHRTQWLHARGFRVVRFWNHDVLLRTADVLEEILRKLEQ